MADIPEGGRSFILLPASLQLSPAATILHPPLIPLRPCRPHQTLDLTGSRDFLTKDNVEDALKAMLVPGAAIKKARTP